MTFRARHLLGVEQLAPDEITTLLDLAESYVALNRRTVKHGDALEGLTQINLFFENSTRTQSSFELAGKRLGADVMNMAVAQSSVKKGETLIDTALTLNAMCSRDRGIEISQRHCDQRRPIRRARTAKRDEERLSPLIRGLDGSRDRADWTRIRKTAGQCCRKRQV